MPSSLRARLFLIVGTAALSLLLMLVGSAIIGAQQTRDLQDVEQRLVPKLELGPKLEAEFEHLRQAMQDAVAAQDPQALDAVLERRNHIFDLIAATHGVIDPNDAALLRWTLHDYYEVARDVSRRLIAGETGEDLVDQMARMQVQQAKVNELIKRTTSLSRDGAGLRKLCHGRQSKRARVPLSNRDWGRGFTVRARVFALGEPQRVARPRQSFERPVAFRHW